MEVAETAPRAQGTGDLGDPLALARQVVPNLFPPVTPAPSYDGRGLVNLIAEVEYRLTGSAPWARLEPDIGSAIPDTATYVLVLFDGLGVAQLEHHKAAGLATGLAAVLDAPFPTTTSVSLATVATGLPPSKHGQVSHLTWMEDLDRVVNCLKWVDLTGEPVTYDYSSVLPAPNLWERLRSSGIEPITVQPGEFAGSPLSRVLYRGARFEGIWDYQDLISATGQLASVPGRLVFTYVPPVDFAGHVYGLDSPEFTEAMGLAANVWEGIAAALPPDVTLLGTADHGLLQFSEGDKTIVRDRKFDGLRFAGDPRGIHIWGDDSAIAAFASATGGELTHPSLLLGPDPTGPALSRVGRKLVLAPPDKVILPKGFDKRLKCYHGGLSPSEVQVPLLIG